MRMQSCRVCERVCTLKANKNETHAPTKLSSKRAMQWMCTIYLCYVHDVIGWNGKIAGNWGKRLVHPADTWISEYGNACTHTHTHTYVFSRLFYSTECSLCAWNAIENVFKMCFFSVSFLFSPRLIGCRTGWFSSCHFIIRQQSSVMLAGEDPELPSHLLWTISNKRGERNYAPKCGNNKKWEKLNGELSGNI